MAKIHPFRGLRYNPELFPDFSTILCPPYDIITTQERERYYSINPFNVIRLESGKDSMDEDRYKLAGATLRKWLKEKVLLLEDKPAFYLHRYHFTYKGERARRGLIAAVNLDEKFIRPHEYTLHPFIEDRLKLLKACNANISPILALYNEPQIPLLLASVEETPPLISIYGEESHFLWRINQPELIEKIQSLFSPLKIYIADGHHRYETSLIYKKEGSSSGKEAVMMTLVEAHDPGLIIFPIHRLIRDVDFPLPKLREEVGKYFEVQTPSSTEELVQMVESGRGIGLLGLEKPFILKNEQDIPYQLLALHYILKGILGIGEIYYTSNTTTALSLIYSGEYKLAFLMRPLKVEEVIKVADMGMRLPGKATYFYPKEPTGLVIRPLEPDQLSGINIRDF